MLILAIVSVSTRRQRRCQTALLQVRVTGCYTVLIYLNDQSAAKTTTSVQLK